MAPDIRTLVCEAQLEAIRRADISSEIDLQVYQKEVERREKLPFAFVVPRKAEFKSWKLKGLFRVEMQVPDLLLLSPCTPSLMFFVAQKGVSLVVSEVSDLESIQIQYLIEMARDLKIGFLPLTQNQSAVNLVLQTDCPAVILGDFFGTSNARVMAQLQQVKREAPSTLGLLAAFSEEPDEVCQNFMRKLGVLGFFCFEV